MNPSIVRAIGLWGFLLAPVVVPIPIPLAPGDTMHEEGIMLVVFAWCVIPALTAVARSGENGRMKTITSVFITSLCVVAASIGVLTSPTIAVHWIPILFIAVLITAALLLLLFAPAAASSDDIPDPVLTDVQAFNLKRIDQVVYTAACIVGVGFVSLGLLGAFDDDRTGLIVTCMTFGATFVMTVIAFRRRSKMSKKELVRWATAFVPLLWIPAGLIGASGQPLPFAYWMQAFLVLNALYFLETGETRFKFAHARRASPTPAVQSD